MKRDYRSENKRLRALLKNLAEGPLQLAINQPWNDTETLSAALIARRDNVLEAAAGGKFSEGVPAIEHPDSLTMSMHVDAALLSNILYSRLCELMGDGFGNNDCSEACQEGIEALRLKGGLGHRYRLLMLIVDYSGWR